MTSSVERIACNANPHQRDLKKTVLGLIFTAFPKNSPEHRNVTVEAGSIFMADEY